MIPDGWKKATLGEHVDLLTGNAFKSARYTEDVSDIRLLRGDNIGQGFLRWRDAKRWPSSEVEQYQRYALRTGDLVIAMDRTWIPAGLKISEVCANDLPCLLVQRVGRVRSKQTLDQRLLIQLLNSFSFEQYVKGVQTETAVPHISPKDIREFPILLPPALEQRQIADILSTWDRAIEATEKLIANSEAQKKGLMQTLLTGKKRLPGFKGSWVQSKFDDLFEIVIGGTPSRRVQEYWASDAQDGLPWIAISDLKSKYISTTKESITELGANNSNVKWLDAGTVVLSFKLSIGKKAILKTGAYTNEAICGLVPRKAGLADMSFVFHMLEQMDLEESVDQAIKGKTLNKAKLRELVLNHPSFEEQRAIGSAIEAADRHLAVVRVQRDQLVREKTALMQQLLTGKRRVAITKEEAVV